MVPPKTPRVLAKTLFVGTLFAVSTNALDCNDVSGVCEPCCWCIPDDGNGCPDIGDRKTLLEYDDDPDLVERFKEMELLEARIPSWTPQGCQPYRKVACGLTEFDHSHDILLCWKGDLEPSVPVCDVPSVRSDDSACAFVYHDDNYEAGYCDRREFYDLVTLSHRNRVTDMIKGLVVTHEEMCGVCSSAHDLAVNMDPGLNVGSFLCGLKFVDEVGYDFTSITPKMVQDGLEFAADCFENDVLGQDQGGFTPDCAFLWACNAANTHFSECTESCMSYLESCVEDTNSVACQQEAAEIFELPPNECDLNECLSCDEENSGFEFQAFGGRTRRDSGIITATEQEISLGGQLVDAWIGLKRNCSDVANFLQDPCAV